MASNVCSWTLGGNWPNGGEVDIYEGWNDNTINQPALHTGNSATYGACGLDQVNQTSPIETFNCDNTFQSPPNQWLNQGCVVKQDGPWASANGGTCASILPLGTLSF